MWLVTVVGKHVHFVIHLVSPLWHATNSCEKQTCRQRVLCPIYNKSVGRMQNSSDTQKQNFRAFYSEGLVQSLLVCLQTRLDLSADPCSYPTCCLPGMAYVHFYRHKSSKEQRDVRCANEREIDSLSNAKIPLFMCLRPHLSHVRRPLTIYEKKPHRD